MELTDDSVEYRAGGARMTPFSATLRSEWTKLARCARPR